MNNLTRGVALAGLLAACEDPNLAEIVDATPWDGSCYAPLGNAETNWGTKEGAVLSGAIADIVETGGSVEGSLKINVTRCLTREVADELLSGRLIKAGEHNTEGEYPEVSPVIRHFDDVGITVSGTFLANESTGIYSAPYGPGTSIEEFDAELSFVTPVGMQFNITTDAGNTGVAALFAGWIDGQSPVDADGNATREIISDIDDGSPTRGNDEVFADSHPCLAVVEGDEEPTTCIEAPVEE